MNIFLPIALEKEGEKVSRAKVTQIDIFLPTALEKEGKKW